MGSAAGPVDAITAEPTKERQIDMMSVPVLKKDHDAAAALFKKAGQHQQAHPETYYYTRSRMFFRDDPIHPDREIWMFIDEYDNREAYYSSLLSALKNDSEGSALYQAFLAVVQAALKPGETFNPVHDVWTEIKENRIHFAFREPLWPVCAPIRSR